MKKCCKCGEGKPSTNEFFPWRNKAMGYLKRHCKRCESEINALEWKNRSPENEEKRKERDRLRAAKKRAENPEYFKALEQKRRLSANYKAWYEKQKEANRENVFLRNIGSFCSVSPIKCRVCDSFQVKRGKDKPDICNACCAKNLVLLGLSFKKREKDVLCRSCGVIHVAKDNRALCPECSYVRSVIAKRKGRQISRSVKRFTQRCAKYGVSYTQISRVDVFNRDNWACVYCGINVVRSKEYKPNQATIDHVIPLSKGGTHTMDNVVTACQKCNSVKNNTTVLKAKTTNQLVMWMK